MIDLESVVILVLVFLVSAALGWYGLRVRRIAAEELVKEL